MSEALHKACMAKYRATFPAGTTAVGYPGSIIAVANILAGNANRTVEGATIAIFKALVPGAGDVTVSGALSYLETAAGLAAIQA